MDANPPFLHVVLYQPEIPQNTGNIGRTCVALGAKLWIVRPTGFRMDCSQLRRAGLDYWQFLNWEAVDGWSDLLASLSGKRFWLVTKFAKLVHTSVSYEQEDVLVFGCESSGLPGSIRQSHLERQIRIPMRAEARSLNLATSAGIVMYEAARQIQLMGGLHSLDSEYQGK